MYEGHGEDVGEAAILVVGLSKIRDGTLQIAVVDAASGMDVYGVSRQTDVAEKVPIA